MTCELYRHFDISGRLLYVGISGSAFVRLTKGHKGSAAWFDQIASITVEKFNTREEAIEAERRAIKVEKPLYNVTHNDADEQAEMFRAAECGEELERVAVNQSKKSAEPIMGNKARALQIAMAAWPHDYRCHEIIRHCTKDD